MTVTLRALTVDSVGNGDAIDLTEAITRELQGSGVQSGTVTVFVKHTTAAITIIEVEPGLLTDYKAWWDKAVPREYAYKHHLVEGEDNGHAHVRASTLGPSIVIPFTDGCMTLGTWQRVVLMDFDTRARRREIVLQVIGE
jgi:secondary thiamine-phosphate synthase enzyme